MNCIRQQVTKFRMAAFALTVPALLFAGVLHPAHAQTLKVDANYKISGAGYKSVTTSDGTGALPHKIALPKGSSSMTFAIDGGSITKGRCTAPCITITGGNNYNDADGVGVGVSANVQADESISGIEVRPSASSPAYSSPARPRAMLLPVSTSTPSAPTFPPFRPSSSSCSSSATGSPETAPAASRCFTFQAERSLFIWVSRTPVMAPASRAVMETTPVTLS
jgi:hypothetical protein